MKFTLLFAGKNRKRKQNTYYILIKYHFFFYRIQNLLNQIEDLKTSHDDVVEVRIFIFHCIFLSVVGVYVILIVAIGSCILISKVLLY